MSRAEEDDVEDFVDENRTVTADIKYKITSFGADFLVDGLVDRFVKEDIYVPDFQRSFVWTKPQASRFIESILLGLPIPGIFLYREEHTNKMLVVDGLQRLCLTFVARLAITSSLQVSIPLLFPLSPLTGLDAINPQ